MKIKTPVFKELRGSLGKPFLGGLSCYRTDKWGNIVGLKSPSEPRIQRGMQAIYSHQLRYWSLHWNFLTPNQKANYAALGELEGITGYFYYTREKCIDGFLYMCPTNNRWVELWQPNVNPTAEETLHMSDDEEYEDWMYVDFPLSKISRNLEIDTAELYLMYSGEAGWDADGKRVDCHKILDPWKEGEITYNTRPDVSGTETDNTIMPLQMEWLKFDVTADILDLIDTGELFYGWRAKFHVTVAVQESMSGMRSTYPHDDDFWAYLKLIE